MKDIWCNLRDLSLSRNGDDGGNEITSLSKHGRSARAARWHGSILQ